MSSSTSSVSTRCSRSSFKSTAKMSSALACLSLSHLPQRRRWHSRFPSCCCSVVQPVSVPGKKSTNPMSHVCLSTPCATRPHHTRSATRANCSPGLGEERPIAGGMSDPGPSGGDLGSRGQEGVSGREQSEQQHPVAASRVREGGTTLDKQRASSSSAPQRRNLTAQERSALGLGPPRPRPSPSASARPRAGTQEQRPSSTRSPGGDREASGGLRGDPKQQWTLLDQMDAEGFGFLEPSEDEWGVVRVARKWGEWLSKKTGADRDLSDAQEADIAGQGQVILLALVLVIFPVWLCLVLVALGKLDLPYPLLEFEVALRS